MGAALLKLRLLRSLGNSSLTCAGNTIYEVSKDRARKIGGIIRILLYIFLLKCVTEYSDAFYANLLTRRASVEETKNVKEKCDTITFKNVSLIHL